MTGPQGHQPPPALSGQILGPGDYAQFGAHLGQAGFTTEQVSEIIGTIEREATAVAMAGARQVAMSALNKIAQTINNVQWNAGMEIHRQICNRNGGTGGVGFHRRCAEIAASVAGGVPLHKPRPAQPVIGSPR
jgi:hypothetical protein